MKRSISNNKKSPINNNEDEVNIDVNLLLNDPKSLHKMLNKKSDDNDYVPTGANPNKLSNRPKNPYKGRPYYYDEGLWEGKKPEAGQHFKLGNIKRRTEDKQERIAKEQLEKLKAMRTVKKKEEAVESDVRPPLAFFKEEGSKMLSKRLPKKEKDDIPEFASYAKKKYGKEDVVETDVRPPLAFFKEEGAKMLKKYISKDKRKENNDDVTKKPKDKENNLIENFLNRKEFDNVRKELEKRRNKPKGKAVNDLNENPKFKKGAEVLRTLGF
jgi:hypothetical protein